MLAGLMGDTDYPALPGAFVQFGFNEGVISYPTASRSALAQWVEDEGLLYNARSDNIAGVFNIFTTIEGYSVQYWDSQIALCEEIRSVIKAHGYPISDFTVKCFVQRQTDEGEPVVMQPVIQPPGEAGAGGSGGGGGNNKPPGKCSDKTNIPDWLSCEFGIGTAGTLVVGGLAVLIAITLLKR